jgi:hypothetical protein
MPSGTPTRSSALTGKAEEFRLTALAALDTPDNSAAAMNGTVED